MFSKFAALGFAEKFFIGFVAVGMAVSFYDQFSQSSRQSGIQSAQEKCLKEAEEIKANALPHEVWKKVPPVCDPEAIIKLEQKTSTQKAIPKIKSIISIYCLVYIDWFNSNYRPSY